MKTTLKLVLDWTPNTNHIGFFIAQELGFYQEEGITLEILSPLEDNYQVTPGKKLELGLADVAIAPFETVISLNNKTNPVDAIAIFAILQEDISSIASLKDKGLSSPKDLDGNIYASYKARYEDHIVKQMIKNAGGQGNIEISYPEKLGIWNTLLEQKADATWIFNNWEGIEATHKNIALQKFSMKDFGIPYCYSPVVLAKKDEIDNNASLYRKFLKATKKGFMYVKDHVEESENILKKHLTEYDQKNMNLIASIQYTIPYFGIEKTCGKMEDTRVKSFLQWLVKHNLEHENILHQELFTNNLND